MFVGGDIYTKETKDNITGKRKEVDKEGDPNKVEEGVGGAKTK